MVDDLEKQYSKHFKGSTNKMQVFRLKKEFEKVSKEKMHQISQNLKPHNYRDRSLPPNYMSRSESSWDAGDKDV